MKGESLIEMFLYFSSSKENLMISISAFKIKVTLFEDGKGSVLYSGKIKVKL